MRAASKPGLRRRDYPVLIVIGSHADRATKRAFPSMAMIAACKGLDRAKVPSSIARLEAAERGGNRGGIFRSSGRK